jgi:hypothetical protein
MPSVTDLIRSFHPLDATTESGLAEVAAWCNALRAALANTTRDDDELLDESVREYHLHPEVLALIGTAGLSTSSAGLALILAVDAPAQRSLLGLGSAALYDVSTFVPVTSKGQTHGVASLDSNGLVPSTQIPPIAITDTYVSISEVAMLGLSAEVGDVCVRSDINETYILQTLPPSVLGNWVKISSQSAMPSTQIGFGSGTNLLTGSNDFTWNDTTKALQITGKQTISQGTITAAANALEVTSTWNNGSEVFTLLSLGVTTTASQLGSAVFRVAVGGSDVFAVLASGDTNITGRANIAQGTVTGAYAALQVTSTWDNVGTGFEAISLNVTNTASDLSSKLLALKTDGVEKFSVGWSGSVSVVGSAPTTYTASTVEIGGGIVKSCQGYFNTSGVSSTATGAIYGVNGETYPRLTTRIDGRLAWGDGTALADAFLQRVGAGCMSLTSSAITTNAYPTLAISASWNASGISFLPVLEVSASGSYANSSQLLRVGITSGAEIFGVTSFGVTIAGRSGTFDTDSALQALLINPPSATSTQNGGFPITFQFNGRTITHTGTPVGSDAATIYIQPTTYAHSTGGSLSDCSTLLITGAPIAGSNMTISNAYALRIKSGTARFEQGTITTATRAALEVTSTWNSGAVTFTGVSVNVTDTASSITSNLINLQVGGTSRFAVRKTGGFLVTQAATSSATPTPIATFTGGSNTAISAGAEASDVRLSLARTVQWATGALTTQRAVQINAPTYAFVGASTLTNAATLAIDGAPLSGTNATITNSYALWIESGKVCIADTVDGALIVAGKITAKAGVPASFADLAAVRTYLASILT